MASILSLIPGEPSGADRLLQFEDCHLRKRVCPMLCHMALDLQRLSPHWLRVCTDAVRRHVDICNDNYIMVSTDSMQRPFSLVTQTRRSRPHHPQYSKLPLSEPVKRLTLVSYIICTESPVPSILVMVLVHEALGTIAYAIAARSKTTISQKRNVGHPAG